MTQARVSKVTLQGLVGVEGMAPVDLAPGTYILGRADRNDIVIKKNDISRQHARLEVKEDGLWVTDLGSANGTRVNGRRVGETTLVADSDEVEFGDRKFRCKVEMTKQMPPAPPVSAPPPPSTAPVDSGSLEATAIWTPPSKAQEPPPDLPAMETATWEPPPEGLPPPPATNFATSTEDVPVAKLMREELPAVAPSAPKPKKAAPPSALPAKAPRRGLLIAVLLLLLLVVGGAVIALVVSQLLQARGGAKPEDEGPLIQVDAQPETPQFTLGELGKLSRPDRQLYNRAIYFIEVKNYPNARAVLGALAAKYPGNKAIDRKRRQVETAINQEVTRLLQYASESARFLKYEEAIEAYRAAQRLVAPQSKEWQEADRQVRQIEAKLAEPKLE